MRMYHEDAEWFHLLTHPDDYAEEAATYTELILEACPGARSLLELGSGGGNNAVHMKKRFAITLSDLSPRIIAVSRTINPELEHVEGDMREMRLGRTFDAVFVHDSVQYMTTLADLALAAATAFIHTRPGGVGLFVPDFTKETLECDTDCGGHDGPGGRGLRYLEWCIDTDPDDHQIDVHYAWLIREGDSMRVEQDHHIEGLFSEAEWLETLGSAGFSVEARKLAEDVHEGQVGFICRRP